MGDSTLDSLYFDAVLFGINTYRWMENKDCKENMTMTTILPSEPIH